MEIHIGDRVADVTLVSKEGTASVLGHNDIHIIRFSVNHKLYLIYREELPYAAPWQRQQ